MRRGLAAVLASSLAFASRAADAPLALRLSERLAAPPSGIAGAGAADAEITPAESLPPAPPRRPKLRRKLTLETALAAWSGTRRNDSADAVLVPRVGLDASAALPAGFSTALLADAAREQAHPSSDSRTQAQLRAAWVGWKQGASSARLGWQIVNWGRTDVLNPTDNVAARDYTRLVDRDADQKLGLPMLSLQQRLPGDASLQLLWQPLFRASRVPLPAQPGLRYVDDRAAASPASVGLRLEAIGEQFSGSLSYFRGPAKLPNLRLQAAPLARGELGLNHPHTEVFGADGEAVFGPWVLRGESAWTQARGSRGDPIASRESALDTVIGLERAFGPASAFVQGEWKWIPGWIDPRQTPAALRPLALANASFDDELHRHRGQLGAGFALNTSDLRWSLSVDAAWAPADGDWALRPRLRLRLDDRLQLLAGGDWFRGPERGVYGRLRPSSALYVGLAGSWGLDAWLTPSHRD